ncbi:MAG: hypothetical protein K6F50_00865 [Kiritimatiellae bacterium]|nr:hypothetical protein [Kiritimatiellia bacterium]
MKLKLNREFLVRHLFAFAVFAALGGWFGFDALVRYPAADAAALYKAIEGSEPAKGTDLESFKRGKIATQRVFAILALLAAAGVGIHLAAVALVRVDWDDAGFSAGGVKRQWADVASVDDSLWEKKGVLRLSGEGWKLTLDAWHHTGVKEFFKKIQDRG